MFTTRSETFKIPENVEKILVEHKKLGEFKKILFKNSFKGITLSLIYSAISDHIDVDKIIKYLNKCPDSYAIVSEILELIRENADESILNLIYDENGNLRSYHEINHIRNLFIKGYNKKQIETCLEYYYKKNYFIIHHLAKFDIPESILSQIPNIEEINFSFYSELPYSEKVRLPASK